jgi:hypothetical protein
LNPKSSLGAVSAAVRAGATPPAARDAQPRTIPVVTISRQAGVPCRAVVDALAAALNAGDADPPWTCYDRELVERVAAEHDGPPDLVAKRDEHDEPWFDDVIRGLSNTGSRASVAIKIAGTIRSLAARGHVIIVGRGGQSILAARAGTLHVRLTAPEPWRVERYAAERSLEPDVALREVRTTDADRARFIRSHFNHDPADPELYHAVLNLARLAPEQAARAVAALLDA